jgi:hypothetical protein
MVEGHPQEHAIPMRNNPVPAILVAIAAVIVLILALSYARAMFGGAHPAPMPANTAGPAQAGALETGGALKPEEGEKSMPPRDMRKTISTYPPPPSVAASEGVR